MVRVAKPALLDRLGQGSCAIKASAGTGKTYTLEHLIVQFLLEGIPLERILVVTFTRKATLELVARVRAKLEELLALEADAWREGEPFWEIGPEARALLRRALETFDRATISTIHGFCQQVLADTAFEGARPFRQELASGEELFDRAFREALRGAFPRHPLFPLALARLGGPEALRDLLREALPEAEGLLLPGPELLAFLDAYPEAAAAALVAELEAYEASKAKGPLFRALDAAGVGTASAKALAGRLRGLLAGMAEARAFGDLRALGAFVDLKALGADAVRASLEKAIHAPGELGALAAATLDLLEQPLAFEGALAAALLPPLQEHLVRLKAEEGLYDYDDMIRLVQEALEGPGGEALARRLRERFQVALIDEFQDTDARQWSIFRRVFLEAGDPHRLVLVGDPKQAIYGFRGGDLPTYLEALGRLPEPLQLTTNFRSAPGVVEACNALLRQGDGGLFTGDNARNYDLAVGCGRPELRCMDASGAPLPPVRVLEVGGRADAATALAVALRGLLAGARFGAAEDLKPIRPEDVFVLTRSAREGAQVAAALRRAGVAAAFYRQEGLFDGSEAEACRDLMMALDAPLEESRRAKALLGPFFGMTLSEAERCRTLPERHPVLLRLFAWRELALEGRWGACFSRILSESGVTRRLLFLEAGQRRLTNLCHILELLQREALARHATPLDLAVRVQAWIDGRGRPAVEDGEVQRLERASGAVQIMTLHKAKGLEAPVVALYGGLSAPTRARLHRYHEQGKRRAWLGSRSLAPRAVQEAIAREEAEEWERLVYVGITRARGQLILPLYRGARVGGLYGCLNRRLEALTSAPEPVPGLLLQPAPEAPPEDGDPAARLAAWRPEPPPGLPGPDFRGLARRGRPAWTFSFSSLMRGLQDPERAPHAAEEARDPEGPQGPGGGARLGVEVHAFLQEVDPATLAGRDLRAWKAHPEVARLAERCLSPGAREEVLAWAHRALGGPLPLPEGGAVRLAEVAPMLRELDFLTPYPGHPDLLEGSIDLLFRHGGKAFVLDWKTNRLPAYDAPALEAAMADHYALQVKVYTLAACRFLGLDSPEAYAAGFGGVLYVFLRGLPEGGVWTARPDWETVQRWVRELEALPLAQLIPAHAGGGLDG